MDTAVKQRLLGGIVLVAGAAVLLPLMLDGSGAKLLGRLEPMPARPAVATVEQVKPDLNQQQLEAEDDISQNQGQDTPFYSLSKPSDPEQMVAEGKTPQQIADDLAAQKRAAQLLAATEEITPELAHQQKAEADKLERDLIKAQTETANQETLKQAEEAAAAKRLEAEKALAMLSATNTQDQQDAAKLVAEKAAKQKADEFAKAERLA
ncbi:MAG TPA: hypothetical protein PLN40_14130, partial [Agitococcus sp.]|nr:hypothetical protein [Agitococcus sp.]